MEATDHDQWKGCETNKPTTTIHPWNHRNSVSSSLNNSNSPLNVLWRSSAAWPSMGYVGICVNEMRIIRPLNSILFGPRDSLSGRPFFPSATFAFFHRPTHEEFAMRGGTVKGTQMRRREWGNGIPMTRRGFSGAKESGELHTWSAPIIKWQVEQRQGSQFRTRNRRTLHGVTRQIFAKRNFPSSPSPFLSSSSNCDTNFLFLFDTR